MPSYQFHYAYTSCYAFSFFPVITVLCSGPCLKDYVVVDSKQKHVFGFEGKVFLLPI